LKGSAALIGKLVLWQNEVGVGSIRSHCVATKGSDWVSAPDKSTGPLVVLWNISCTFGEVLFPECFHIIIICMLCVLVLDLLKVFK